MKWSIRKALGLNRKEIIGQGALAEWSGASRQDGSNFRTSMVTLADHQDSGASGEGAVLGLSTAWACVNLVAGTVGSISFDVMRKVGRLKEPAPEHPLQRILDESPNSEQTGLDFWEIMAAAIELRGNAYAEIERAGDGRVIALSEPIPPQYVSSKRLKNGSLEYEWTLEGRTRRAPQDRMLHIRGALGGLSPLTVGLQTFKLARSINTAANATFRNGVHSTGAFISDKALTPEQQQMAVEKIESAYAGAMNAGRPMLLNNGMTFQSLSINPEDAQMLESRAFSVEEICRFFGVPPHMVGHTEKTTSWGTGLEQQTLGFLMYTMRRRLKRIEKSVAKQLLTAKDRAEGISLRFNIEDLLRADTTARAAYFQAALGDTQRPGWMLRNEVRRHENLTPVDGWDDPIPLISQTQPKPDEA